MTHLDYQIDQNLARQVPTCGKNIFEVEKIRRDFPILERKIRGKRTVYLDNAATSQKPQVVIDAISQFYSEKNANVHRGLHYLSEQATISYEKAREKVKNFINAASSSEIIFVRGATEGINLVAQTFGRINISRGDEIILTQMEHHSNIVPWQILCEQTGAKLKVAPIKNSGELLVDEFEKLLTDRTKLVALTHVSNALGTINPVSLIIKIAHQVGVPVLIDGAQAAPHLRVDVQELDCDFYVLSGHKLMAPTGIGVLYGKKEILEAMPPYQGGGEMITRVSFEKTVYSQVPHKFEAGTPDIAGAIGLGAALDYLTGLDLDSVFAYEDNLLVYASEAIQQIPGLQIIGTAPEKAGIISFILDDIHPHDIGTILDRSGIAVRVGHHCAMPLMERLGLPATTRASLAFYNTRNEIDALVEGLKTVKEIFN